MSGAARRRSAAGENIGVLVGEPAGENGEPPAGTGRQAARRRRSAAGRAVGG